MLNLFVEKVNISLVNIKKGFIFKLIQEIEPYLPKQIVISFV